MLSSIEHYNKLFTRLITEAETGIESNGTTDMQQHISDCIIPEFFSGESVLRITFNYANDEYIRANPGYAVQLAHIAQITALRLGYSPCVYPNVPDEIAGIGYHNPEAVQSFFVKLEPTENPHIISGYLNSEKIHLLKYVSSLRGTYGTGILLNGTPNPYFIYKPINNGFDCHVLQRFSTDSEANAVLHAIT